LALTIALWPGLQQFRNCCRPKPHTQVAFPSRKATFQFTQKDYANSEIALAPTQASSEPIYRLALCYHFFRQWNAPSLAWSVPLGSTSASLGLPQGIVNN
jgi:hypothetical protein